MLKRLTATISALFLCAAAAWAGKFSFTGGTDNLSAIYQPGEKMVFSVQLLEDSRPLAGKKLKWERTGDDQKTEKGEAVSSVTESLTITTSSDKPGFVRIVVMVAHDDEKSGKNTQDQNIKFEGGAGVALEKLASCPEPRDFNAFWAKQKAKLAQVPLKASLTNVPSEKPNFVVSDVKVDCAGGKPVSGYLSKPKDAGAKSLAALVVFSGYGVTSAEQVFKDGKLIFSINAHGIENGREPEYYKKLQEGGLKGYAFNKEENSNPETAYFNGMMLRVLRALEFVKSQPEWDGKNLTVSGGSQGGFQALVAAGLDQDVTMCSAYKPWCCDLGGINLGRLRGWRPDYTEALGYYDPVNHAKRIKCETSLSSGLGDYICPPSGLTVLYNNIQAPKQIEYIQGATHSYNPPNAKRHIISNK